MRKPTLFLALLVAAAAVGAHHSDATTPGKNGRIAFRRYFDAGKTWGAIFTINSDGSAERQVTHPPKGVIDAPPRWSPDGSLIAFSRGAKDGTLSIYTVRPDGSHLTRLSPACRHGAKCEDDSGAGFAPDGRHIVFSRFTASGSGSSIVLTDLHGRHLRVLVPGTKHAAYVEPEVSPDGERLVFTQSLEPGDKLLGVVVSSLNGSHRRRVTPTALDAGDAPSWSPDGTWILFRSHVDGGGQSQIYVVHPNGTGLTQLTHFKAGAIVTSSRFSPDGQWIVFATNGVGGRADLFLMHADGTDMQPITRTKLWESAPAWGTAAG